MPKLKSGRDIFGHPGPGVPPSAVLNMQGSDQCPWPIWVPACERVKESRRGLHNERASFETRPLGAPQDEAGL